MSDLPKVKIYVDGAAIPNPGHAGAGIVLLFGEHRKELSVYLGQCTNNVGEMQAAIHALNALKCPCEVELWSDSQYLISTMNGEFQRGKNLPIWYQLDEAAKRHRIFWNWQKGHIGHEFNERAHELAEQAARRQS